MWTYPKAGALLDNLCGHPRPSPRKLSVLNEDLIALIMKMVTLMVATKIINMNTSYLNSFYIVHLIPFIQVW
jgi:hypothetical protein